METVTGLISLLDKPGLLIWANKIGLAGTSLKEYRAKSTQAGTDNHNKVELFFKEGKRFDGCEVLERNLAGFNVVSVEQEVSNGLICGRVDLILEKNGCKYVIDFKSNQSIYLTTKIQLSSYLHLSGSAKIGVINFEQLSLTELSIDTAKYYEILKRLYQVKQLLNDLNERL